MMMIKWNIIQCYTNPLNQWEELLIMENLYTNQDKISY